MINNKRRSIYIHLAQMKRMLSDKTLDDNDIDYIYNTIYNIVKIYKEYKKQGEDKK